MTESHEDPNPYTLLEALHTEIFIKTLDSFQHRYQRSLGLLQPLGIPESFVKRKRAIQICNYQVLKSSQLHYADQTIHY